MKNYSLLFLFVFFLLACSNDQADMPRLELDTILLNDGEEDYSHNLEGILPLRPRDYIDVSFLLHGNGADLNTFMVKNDSKNINSILILSSYESDQISDDLSNISEGMLYYKDNIRDTKVTVRLEVRSAKEEESKISFYLNSKDPDLEGDMYYLDLKTTTQPRE